MHCGKAKVSSQARGSGNHLSVGACFSAVNLTLTYNIDKKNVPDDIVSSSHRKSPECHILLQAK